jgi:hypothetical protein
MEESREGGSTCVSINAVAYCWLERGEWGCSVKLRVSEASHLITPLSKLHVSETRHLITKHFCLSKSHFCAGSPTQHLSAVL